MDNFDNTAHVKKNVPDKIYLGIQDLGSDYVYALSLDNNGEQEYIRKEALLEWAKMKKSHIKIVDWDDDYCFGLDFMLDELIDKLNEM